MDAFAFDIPMKRLDESLDVPVHAKPGDAGFDLRSAVSLELLPGKRACIPCGIALGLPPGFAGLVLPRSGLAADHGITVVNAPGIIDAGYRGEVKVILLNTDDQEPFSIAKGDRIAQLLIIPVPEIDLTVTPELDDTLRGDAGFGSSGV